MLKEKVNWLHRKVASKNGLRSSASLLCKKRNFQHAFYFSKGNIDSFRHLVNNQLTPLKLSSRKWEGLKIEATGSERLPGDSSSQQKASFSKTTSAAKEELSIILFLRDSLSLRTCKLFNTFFNCKTVLHNMVKIILLKSNILLQMYI